MTSLYLNFCHIYIISVETFWAKLPCTIFACICIAILRCPKCSVETHVAIGHKELIRFVQTFFQQFFWCALFNYLYISYIIKWEPELGVGFDSGMTLAPFPSSILMRRVSNPQTFDRELSLLTTRPDWCPWFGLRLLTICVQAASKSTTHFKCG